MPNPGFVLATDAALKRRLMNIEVTDKTGPHTAQCFFRFPEGEVEKHYPFITINLVDIDFADYRQESERNYYYYGDDDSRSDIDYYPDLHGPADMEAMRPPGGVLSTEQFVAIDLLYQVDTYARNHRHDIQMTALLMRRVFPWRRGFIEVEEDGTIRRCDLLDWSNTTVQDQEAGYNKVVFRKTFTVRITAEIPQSDLLGAGTVEEIHGLLRDYNPSNSDLSPSFTEEF